MSNTPVIDQFLNELAAALSGPRRSRDETLAEIHSHLLDALESAGESAETRIVDQFGDPRVLAGDLNKIKRGLRGVDLRLRWLGASVASAVTAFALVAVWTSPKPGDRGLQPSASATWLIGTLVGASPDIATVRLRDGRRYVLRAR
jgi:hypothetical protein